jgi:hypothetical protein
LIERVRKKQTEHVPNEVLLLCSVDEDGHPNIALMSYLDILILSPTRILLAIGEKSSSRRNLVATGKGTIVIWAGRASGMFYLKGSIKLVKSRLETLVEGFTCSALTLRVHRVSQDYSSRSEIISTVTYKVSKSDQAHRVLFEELNRLAHGLPHS